MKFYSLRNFYFIFLFIIAGFPHTISGSSLKNSYRYSPGSSSVISLRMALNHQVSRVPATLEFEMSISNDILVTPNILEFDLTILSLDTTLAFELASVQACIALNPAILNGGTLSCVIKNNTSSLNILQRPVSVSYVSSSATIELLPQPYPGPGNGTLISTDPLSPSRICRLRLSNTVPWACQQANLNFITGQGTFTTALSKYSGTSVVVMETDTNNCISRTQNPYLNYPPPPMPSVFSMTGNGLVCPEALPVILGIDGSESGVTYILERDGIPAEYSEGTGGSLEWPCYVPGLYTVHGVNPAGSIAMNGAIQLQFYPEPFLSMISTGGPVCEGFPVRLEVSVQNPGVEGYYEWWIQSASGNRLEITSSAVFTYMPENGDLVSVRYMESAPCDYSAESGYIVFNVHPASSAGNILGGGTIFLGNSTGPLELANFTGSILKWQKQYTSEPWSDIPCTLPVYSEVPVQTGLWSYRAIVQSFDCPADTSESLKINVFSRRLSVKVYPQGSYNPLTMMLEPAGDGSGPVFHADTADLVTLRIVNGNLPFNEVFRAGNIPISTEGIITTELPSTITAPCYLVVNHRNSIETWSSEPVDLSGNLIQYNFTTGANKAYGFNQMKAGNNWVIYGGDVNQDGLVDAGDMIPVDNLSSVFSTGYITEDANSDGLMDSGDMIIVENNTNNFVGSLFPYYQELPMVISHPVHSIGINAASCRAEVVSQGSAPVTERGICWSTSPYPTIEGLKTPCGSGTGLFTADINSLNTATHYYLRAYAINLSGITYGESFSFTTLAPGGGSPYLPVPILTIGNQTYNTIKIGSQVWMRENLNTGMMISNSQASVNNDTIEKYCHADIPANCDLYGGLYNWEEVMRYETYASARGICPEGWHIPSGFEWSELRNFLGGNQVAGGKMKETGNKHWASPNVATNESGFSALPSDTNRISGYWFTSSQCDPGMPDSRMTWYDSPFLDEHIGCSKSPGYLKMSVRCIMDDSLSQASVNTLPVTAITSSSARCGGKIRPTGGTAVTSRGICWGLNPNPTVEGNHTTEYAGVGDFRHDFNGLLPDTIYYIRAYAINAAGTAYGQERYFSTTQSGEPCPGTDSLVYEGKTYRTVLIGNQCWMKENLDVGNRIQGTIYQQDNGIIEKYCYEDDPENCEAYGGLYMWDEAMQYQTIPGSRGICPVGWHIPTMEEWSELGVNLGGYETAGGSMKETGTAKWKDPNVGATNESGFSAFPAGSRTFINSIWTGSSYSDLEFQASFWTSSKFFDYLPQARILSWMNAYLNEGILNNEGISIRCIMTVTQ